MLASSTMDKVKGVYSPALETGTVIALESINPYVACKNCNVGFLVVINLGTYVQKDSSQSLIIIIDDDNDNEEAHIHISKKDVQIVWDIIDVKLEPVEADI